MDRTTVTCTDNDKTVGADILSKNDRHMKVALDGTELALELYKATPQAAVYVGHLHGMEFISTGE